MDRVTVIGIGRIGLCLALNLDRAGYEVLGIDKNDVHVRQVNEKKLCTSEPGVEDALQSARKFKAVDNIAPIRAFAPDLIFVAVDTPTAEGGGYDHSRVDCVLDELFRLEPWRTRVELALVCTTFPGYCDSKAALARSHSYALSYNPGFIAQGSILRDQLSPDQVLIGEADAVAGEKLESIYRAMCLNQPAIHRMTPLSAEVAKLATNCALTMKIAFANAIGDLASSVGAQPERVLAAIGADSRIGNKFFKYGFGYGGPCFARDNQALDLFAKQHNFDFPQANVTDEMIVERCACALERGLDQLRWFRGSRRLRRSGSRARRAARALRAASRAAAAARR